MKYEWKNIWKAGTLMLLGMLVVTVIGCVVLRMPGGLVTEIADGNNMNATQSWFVLSSFVATLILYVIMLLASTWGMLIFLGIRFYRSMYTDEGYLSHTLPVTANQLFLSKVLVSGVWYLFITIGIGISVVALIVSLMTGLLNIGELSTRYQYLSFRQNVCDSSRSVPVHTQAEDFSDCGCMGVSLSDRTGHGREK